MPSYQNTNDIYGEIVLSNFKDNHIYFDVTDHDTGEINNTSHINDYKLVVLKDIIDNNGNIVLIRDLC